MEIQAFAKLNLTLDVLGKRPDGYHDLRMVMQSITLCDTLTLTSNQGQGLRVSTDLHFLPTGEKNLAAIAAAGSGRPWAVRLRTWTSASGSAFRCAPAWPVGAPTPPPSSVL